MLNMTRHQFERWQKKRNPFYGMSFQAIRPTMRAQELVAVQPMNQPSNLLFYMDYNYSAGIHPPNTGHYAKHDSKAIRKVAMGEEIRSLWNNYERECGLVYNRRRSMGS